MKSFYMMGCFEKGSKAVHYFDTRKPFEVDNLRGVCSPRVFHFFGNNNVWFNEWEYMAGFTLKDLGTNNQLRRMCNETWSYWCKKHGRKYKPIFEEVKDEI